MNSHSPFDADYYQRFYVDPNTRAISPEAFSRLGDFVCGYVKYMEHPVGRVLDLGCGMGYWQTIIESHFAGADYVGVETSEYLCERYGWQRGSVVDFKSRHTYDLVICSDVLQYLSASDARAALANLAKLCDGCLFFGVLTIQDWDENCDQERTDREGQLRSGDWYRRELARYFVNAGGGVFVKHDADIVLYDLEKLTAVCVKDSPSPRGLG